MMVKKRAPKPVYVEPVADLPTDIAVAGLATQHYAEVAPIGSTRVFKKALIEGKNYVFLAESGELRSCDRRSPADSHRISDRILVMLRDKGVAARAAKVAAGAQPVSPVAAPEGAFVAPELPASMAAAPARRDSAPPRRWSVDRPVSNFTASWFEK